MTPIKKKPLTYLLRDIDADLWDAFNARSAEIDIPMRSLLLAAVRGYVEGRIELAAQPVVTAPAKRAGKR